MAYTASKLLEIARGELGYKEKETNYVGYLKDVALAAETGTGSAASL